MLDDAMLARNLPDRELAAELGRLYPELHALGTAGRNPNRLGFLTRRIEALEREQRRRDQERS